MQLSLEGQEFKLKGTHENFLALRDAFSFNRNFNGEDISLVEVSLDQMIKYWIY